jgi:mRNA interferase HigB
MGNVDEGESMRVLSRSTLREFWEQPKYADSEPALTAWYDEAKHANWQTPQDIKALYRNASFVGNNRVVFNIHGNKYRLITAINYKFSMVYVRFVGTHAEYDKVDATTV